MLFTLLMLACGKDTTDPAADDTDVTVEETAADDTGDTVDLSEPRQCGATFRYEPTYAANGVYVAGDFNDWSDSETPMDEVSPGVFEIALDLDPGIYTYKFVEKTGQEYWVCDPDAQYVQCDEYYDAGGWNDCQAGGNSCNSMIVIEDCAPPIVHLTSLDIDREADSATLNLAFQPGASGAAMGAVSLTVNGAPQTLDWDLDAPTHEVTLTGLTDGRFSVRVDATDVEGGAAEQLYVPFWTDERSWENGLLYYVFVDRFHNGDGSLDGSEGTTHASTDYQGGDWQGVIDKLGYLDDMGVTALWLTAPIDNASGAWGWDCEANFSGYHGYWPSSAFEPEGHFGTLDTFRELVDAAHARGMRVMVDWVGNHVHTQHPYYTDHPDWFAETPAVCDDYNNWNDIPETCWFDAFLPDIYYYNPEPLDQMVDDAIVWVKDFELDGYRVDAVKHMPRSVFYNMESRVQAEIEHTAAGGDEDFYTVGETFDGDRGLLASYIGDKALDAQFDFPLYFTLRGTFLSSSATLIDAENSYGDSQGAYGGALMSTFVGNHDVERSISVSAEGERGMCDEYGFLREPAWSPDWEEPYLRLNLSWTWLLTHKGLPLVYYGDEIGLPGYADPDNRQLMKFDGLSGNEQAVLDHVKALGQARLAHPQLALGEATTWWEEEWVHARALTHEGQHALVIINLSWDERTLSNGLEFAGLPTDGTWVDVLTGNTVVAAGDAISVTVPAMKSVVLVPQ